MARVVIIGASCDVGTYFVPALVERGHEVVTSAVVLRHYCLRPDHIAQEQQTVADEKRA